MLGGAKFGGAMELDGVGCGCGASELKGGKEITYIAKMCFTCSCELKIVAFLLSYGTFNFRVWGLGICLGFLQLIILNKL